MYFCNVNNFIPCKSRSVLSETQHLTPPNRLLHITWLSVPAGSKALVYSCPPQKMLLYSDIARAMQPDDQQNSTGGSSPSLFKRVRAPVRMCREVISVPHHLPSGAINACYCRALSQLERPTPLRQLCLQQWIQSYYCDKGFPLYLSSLAGDV